MVMYAKIRRMYHREHLSINEIQRRTSLSRNAIKKWLQAPSDSTVKYQRAKKPGKLTPFESRLMLALEADARRPKKDRRTALLLFKEILNEGYTGGYTIVCDFIRVNQRAKLARVLGETALKSFHSGLLNNRHLVGELWSVTNGYYCGSKKTAFCQQGKY